MVDIKLFIWVHYSDNYKITNYKIIMEIQKKITVLSENLNNLRSALEDFRDHHISKKEKIKNLENEIKNLRKQMSEYIDELELLIKK